MSDLYQEAILEELKNPQNYGELVDADSVVDETNASCGDAVTVFLKFDEKKSIVTDISWVGVGCAISQASVSLLSEKIKGMIIADILDLTQKDMEELLGIQEITMGRVKCMMLGLRAIQKAIT